ncbi:hypothetical protein CBM2586_A110089 [Cupriavidus phytorum]|uniref:Uncharacterized protein n=1 Tax=Cupriavidus taiwanensis TaxID=164546 RepID=A0A975X651_9BURK|nr:hypothetical protein CBM2586_A110089 [Cupriavidus taiwanensis]
MVPSLTQAVRVITLMTLRSIGYMLMCLRATGRCLGHTLVTLNQIGRSRLICLLP